MKKFNGSDVKQISSKFSLNWFGTGGIPDSRYRFKKRRRSMNSIFRMEVVKVVGLLWILIHVFSMIILPLFSSGFDWTYVQNVWDRWQSLNSAIIALASGLIAFQIADNREKSQREKKFIAARASLPHVYSEIIKYCQSSGRWITEAFAGSDQQDRFQIVQISKPNTDIPKLPHNLEEVFNNCIRYADDEFSNFLINLLLKIRASDNMIRSLSDDMNHINNFGMYNFYTISFRLSQVRALLEKTLVFTQGLGNFDKSALVWENIDAALQDIDIYPDDWVDLENFANDRLSEN